MNVVVLKCSFEHSFTQEYVYSMTYMYECVNNQFKVRHLTREICSITWTML